MRSTGAQADAGDDDDDDDHHRSLMSELPRRRNDDDDMQIVAGVPLSRSAGWQAGAGADDVGCFVGAATSVAAQVIPAPGGNSVAQLSLDTLGEGSVTPHSGHFSPLHCDKSYPHSGQ